MVKITLEETPIKLRGALNSLIIFNHFTLLEILSIGEVFKVTVERKLNYHTTERMILHFKANGKKT